MTASPRSKAPSTRRTPAGSRLLPESSAFSAPASISTLPLGSSWPGDPALARRHGIGAAPGTRCRRAPSDSARSGCITLPEVITMLVPEASAMRAGLDLGHHAAARQLGAGAAGHGLDLGRDLAHLVEARGVRAAAGRRGVEAVDVGEQHQAVGAHHAGDAGGQPVVVAVADLAGGHRVVLVDHGDGPLGEQRGDGLARIEVAAALLGVAEREQDLRGGEPVRLERRPGRRWRARSGRRRPRPATAPAPARPAAGPARAARARWRRTTR